MFFTVSLRKDESGIIRIKGKNCPLPSLFGEGLWGEALSNEEVFQYICEAIMRDELRGIWCRMAGISSKQIITVR